MAFSNDGTILASESYDRTIKLWDVKTNAEIITFQESGSNGSVCSVAFNNNWEES